MQTLKTAVVVVLLLVVFFGVYEALNTPRETQPDPYAAELDDTMLPPDVSLGTVSGPEAAEPVVSVPSFDPGTSRSGPEQQSPFPPPDSLATEPPAPDSSADAGALGVAGGPLPASAADSAPGEDTATETPETASEPPVDDAGSSQFVVSEPGGSRYQSNPFVSDSTIGQPPVSPAESPNRELLGERVYQREFRLAQASMRKQQYHDALARLSIFYNSEDLTEDEQRELVDLLDPLAAKVIYSREHLIEPAYKVRPNDTLMDIAQKLDVPWQLLQKINGIEDPRVLLPGAELKVVPGPFRAEVDVARSELTVFLGELYAGRFPITLGSEFAPRAGEYTVRDKREDRTYFGDKGRQIPADSPANPFGGIWLDLGKEVCIHGSPPAGPDGNRGCISLSPRDADDVYSILSVGSRVRIVR